MPAFERAKSSFLQRHFPETVNSPRGASSNFEDEDDMLELRSMDDPQEDNADNAPVSPSLRLPPFSPPPLAAARTARSMQTPLSRSLDNFSLEVSSAPPPPSGGSLMPTLVVSVRSSMPSAQAVYRTALDQENRSSEAVSPARFTRQQVRACKERKTS